ncbi:fibrinogen C domain-containing protein 1 [Striga asiatica]|uniref:Fibrinogen C domain-containing protein 1 n=1 Tax=Striga asiatica TaxID=4170 RepID=A0A5A7R9Z6_STRAF|nr:fibrinogen C domain-containing protein 1 [Striga asiatica]
MGIWAGTGSVFCIRDWMDWTRVSSDVRSSWWFWAGPGFGPVQESLCFISRRFSIGFGEVSMDKDSYPFTGTAGNSLFKNSSAALMKERVWVSAETSSRASKS